MAYQAARAARRGPAAVRPLRRGLPRRHARRGVARRGRAVPRHLPAAAHRDPDGVLARRAARRGRPGPRGRPRCWPRCGRCSAREGERVCAVVVEPLVQAAGGMLTHDPSFLRRGARAVRRVRRGACSSTRSRPASAPPARWFAVEHAGVAPDLMVVGKRLTGGVLPLSAVLARDVGVRARSSATPTAAGRSSTGTPTPPTRCRCAAALANLDADARARDGRAGRGGRRADRRGAGPDWPSYDGVRRGPPGRDDDRHRGAVGRRAHRLRGVPRRPAARRAHPPAG